MDSFSQHFELFLTLTGFRRLTVPWSPSMLASLLSVTDLSNWRMWAVRISSRLWRFCWWRRCGTRGTGRHSPRQAPFSSMAFLPPATLPSLMTILKLVNSSFSPKPPSQHPMYPYFHAAGGLCSSQDVSQITSGRRGLPTGRRHQGGGQADEEGWRDSWVEKECGEKRRKQRREAKFCSQYHSCWFWKTPRILEKESSLLNQSMKLEFVIWING